MDSAAIRIMLALDFIDERSKAKRWWVWHNNHNHDPTLTWCFCLAVSFSWWHLATTRFCFCTVAIWRSMMVFSFLLTSFSIFNSLFTISLAIVFSSFAIFDEIFRRVFPVRWRWWLCVSREFRNEMGKKEKKNWELRKESFRQRRRQKKDSIVRRTKSIIKSFGWWGSERKRSFIVIMFA